MAKNHEKQTFKAKPRNKPLIKTKTTKPSKKRTKKSVQDIIRKLVRDNDPYNPYNDKIIRDLIHLELGLKTANLRRNSIENRTQPGPTFSYRIYCRKHMQQHNRNTKTNSIFDAAKKMVANENLEPCADVRNLKYCVDDQNAKVGQTKKAKPINLIEVLPSHMNLEHGASNSDSSVGYAKQTTTIDSKDNHLTRKPSKQSTKKRNKTQFDTSNSESNLTPNATENRHTSNFSPKDSAPMEPDAFGSDSSYTIRQATQTIRTDSWDMVPSATAVIDSNISAKDSALIASAASDSDSDVTTQSKPMDDIDDNVTNSFKNRNNSNRSGLSAHHFAPMELAISDSDSDVSIRSKPGDMDEKYNNNVNRKRSVSDPNSSIDDPQSEVCSDVSDSALNDENDEEALAKDPALMATSDSDSYVTTRSKPMDDFDDQVTNSPKNLSNLSLSAKHSVQMELAVSDSDSDVSIRSTYDIDNYNVNRKRSVSEPNCCSDYAQSQVCSDENDADMDDEATKILVDRFCGILQELNVEDCLHSVAEAKALEKIKFETGLIRAKYKSENEKFQDKLRKCKNKITHRIRHAQKIIDEIPTIYSQSSENSNGVENQLAKILNKDSTGFIRSFCWNDDMDERFRKMCDLAQQRIWTDYTADILQQFLRMSDFDLDD